MVLVIVKTSVWGRPVLATSDMCAAKFVFGEVLRKSPRKLLPRIERQTSASLSPSEFKEQHMPPEGYGHFPYTPFPQPSREPIPQGEYTQVREEPVPPAPDIVAMLRYPIEVSGITSLVKALKVQYGEGLVIATDIPGSDGWMVVVRPQPAIAA
jgi:hypothetical protein